MDHLRKSRFNTSDIFARPCSYNTYWDHEALTKLSRVITFTLEAGKVSTEAPLPCLAPSYPA